MTTSITARILTIVLCLHLLSGCTAMIVTSAVVGTVAAVVVEVIEIPFEVGGAIIDVVSDDDDDEETEEED